ncbi:MBL fold metallo-hydrolase [Gilvimarinus sp. 2_MG-2023]|uniref:MBL fold metallo-hydrolase n=1 Tax=Gilvimarinus sp. 2_MG-2023 TaxID=3062666 RepID=UPI0026E32691|nr:MBL fold metallo-hydrolase [Gilvimarinus sp. 2_MG-2023]MDO6571300.1 MBL fold metallo-hydrolase [Gilvimarinus sp. 2_MG-2023]
MLRVQIIPVTHYQQNCSLVWCEQSREAALVDPGGEAQKLIDAVERSGLRLTKVLLTHGHMDHVGAATEVARAFEVPIIGPHKEELFWLGMLDQQAQMMGFEPCEAVHPDQWLADGDTVTLGQHQLQVRHCPGHTPGHVVFVDCAAKIAFVGDVLFKGSVGRTDFPRGDQAQLVQAITTKLWPLGDDIQFVPGHGPVSTFGAERASNPFVADKNFG